MTLTCDTKFQRRTYAPGVYINEATIVKAEDVSGEKLPYLQRPVEMGLKLTLDIGREFQPELIIAGELKHDTATGEVIGWGSAFVVQEALSRLGYTGPLTIQNRIPADVLNGLVGKKLLRLSYVSGVRENGKSRYSDWNQIGTPEDGVEELLARWKRSVRRGYPSNYRPMPVEEPGANGGNGDPF